MRKIIILVFGILFIVACFVGLLAVYGAYLDSSLRTNITKIHPGMNEKEVLQVLGKPAKKGLLDNAGSDWYYRTDLLYRLIDGDPNNQGYLVLEMGADGKVLKVFDLPPPTKHGR